jgi:hypothetical protein
MKAATHLLTATALAWTLAACSREPPTPPQLPFAVPGASLTITQVGNACTTEGAYTAKVAWQVADRLPSKLEVQLGTTERQVFARSNERSGSEETGEWVTQGAVFHLLDRKRKTLLASTQAGPGNCTGTASPH